MQTSSGRIIRAVLLAILVNWTIQIAFHFGVREKTFWERFHDLISFGAGGFLVGLVGFLVVGTVGFVTGPIYGAIGVVSYLTIGTATGLGLGGVIHVITNHEKYVFSYQTIIPILIVGCVCSWEWSRWGGLLYDHLQARRRLWRFNPFILKAEEVSNSLPPTRPQKFLR